MSEFEHVLEQCLLDLEAGAASVDQCLARYPEYAVQLQPVLQVADALGQGRRIEPSAAFKARSRSRLTLHMQAHPRRAGWAGFGFWRFAASLAVITLALLTAGTAYAQRALPGDPFYAWKLTSENAWRAVSADPVRTDLLIANRRIDELNAVAGDPIRAAVALTGYQQVITRLRAELEAGTLEGLLPPLEGGAEGIETPAPRLPTLPSTPVATSIPALPLDSTPRPMVTQVPTPGISVPLPTAPPRVVPTIDIPPVLP